MNQVICTDVEIEIELLVKKLVYEFPKEITFDGARLEEKRKATSSSVGMTEKRFNVCCFFWELFQKFLYVLVPSTYVLVTSVSYHNSIKTEVFLFDPKLIELNLFVTKHAKHFCKLTFSSTIAYIMNARLELVSFLPENMSAAACYIMLL